MRSRRGETLISVVINVVLTTAAALTVMKFIASDGQVQASLHNQRDMQALNAFVDDVYRKYKAGYDLTLSSSGEGNGPSLVSLLSPEGDLTSYSYSPGSCWVSKGDVKLFKAERFTVSQTADSVLVSISIDNRRNYECTMYR